MSLLSYGNSQKGLHQEIVLDFQISKIMLGKKNNCEIEQ